MADRDPIDADRTSGDLDPERTGGLTSGAALGASQAPMGHDDVTRAAMREADERPSTDDLIDQLHDAVTDGSGSDRTDPALDPT